MGESTVVDGRKKGVGVRNREWCGSERWIGVRDEWVVENIDLRN